MLQVFVYRLAIVIYNLFFHPLATVPGPRFYGASNVLYAWGLIAGNWTYTLKDLHDKYGPVVRFAPNYVSFITTGAWKESLDIGRQELSLSQRIGVYTEDPKPTREASSSLATLITAACAA